MFSPRSLGLGATNISKVFIRGKKKSVVNPSTQKVVNQLSALSASRKQPKLLKLCPEDLIKHKTITNAWKLFSRKQEEKRVTQLKQQFESIRTAMDELKETSPELYAEANKKEQKRFPLELRVPTDYPANEPWVYNYSKKD
ncbi:putative 54S ribosomal protein [Clavispora lusitaniae]|uniref:54S ribosomal protein n=1 Tax=Clavispora lusitaniae TaxID=36911 RepID=A0ACD0WNF4_CLALS|nr:putative 54S ribosomal protein [Clavispora lusitaniae]QFZ34321.1 putative 54S ribosomal protein [Clavispora lusitaniae]QFZ40005.1 putative 54S ribosomal protein [Clavispora lusitaniae]QFZ45687.1 putative 54S ribosomal protein [Clavispora lusitaniae]QFZ51351.1 putative 54S ribosomal protein [Clavispora lusitaniae]